MARSKQRPLPEGTRVVQARHHVWSDLQEEVAILQLDKGIYYGLNPVGARVWRLLQEERTPEELQRIIASEYEVQTDVVRRDIDALIRRLRREGLVEIIEPGPGAG
jgi:hypothetical protein